MPKRQRKDSAPSDHNAFDNHSESHMSSDDGSYAPTIRRSRTAVSTSLPAKKKAKYKHQSHSDDDHDANEVLDPTVTALHSQSVHVISSPDPIRVELLEWYSGVHAVRNMPWRKLFDPSLQSEERAQRAYEVWISEVMLQQTQVATVIPYYNRWMEKFPTIRDLAAASIDEVNTLWKGLGYYSRASRLLSAAKKVVQEYSGRLPDNAKDMEAKIPGVGRYSAGAICSVAYGERVPVLDGNVHRLLSRLLAVHAPPKAKATLDILWSGADAMVREAKTPCEFKLENIRMDGSSPNSSSSLPQLYQHPGDINQALIELGSTVCKVRDPNCKGCPLKGWCAAYASYAAQHEKDQELPTKDIEDVCNLCDPLPHGSPVTVYPMKVERKKAREELDLVNVIEWRSMAQRWFLLVKRPERGLLAGLHEFPTLPNISKSAAVTSLTDSHVSTLLLTPLQLPKLNGKILKPARTDPRKIAEVPDSNLRITKIQAVGDVVHVFSHIRKTYQVQWILMEGGHELPALNTASNLTGSVNCDDQGSRARRRGKKKDTERVNLGDVDSAVRLQSNVDSRLQMDARWTPLDQLAGENIGTGMVKVWNLTKELWEGS